MSRAMTQAAEADELRLKAGGRPRSNDIQLLLQVCQAEGERQVSSAAEVLSDDQKPMCSEGRTDRAGLAEFSMSAEEGRWPLAERCLRQKKPTNQSCYNLVVLEPTSVRSLPM